MQIPIITQFNKKRNYIENFFLFLSDFFKFILLHYLYLNEFN